MRRLLNLLLLLSLFAAPTVLCAQNIKVQGWCENGNVAVTIPGTQGSGNQKFQQSYPSCTVNVFNAGTVVLSTIFSDSAGTAKANPFPASSSGQWFFYGAAGTHYDVNLSGGGIPVAFTLGDISALTSPCTYIATQLICKSAAGNDIQADTASFPGNIAVGNANLSHADGANAQQNTAIGFNALLNDTGGFSNTAAGFQALTATIGPGGIDGWGNTAVGAQSLAANVTGHENVGAGFQSLQGNTTGHNNVAIGGYSIQTNTTGIQNTAVGNLSLQFANTTGAVAVGYNTLSSASTGNLDTAVGYQAGKFMTAANSTAIGASSVITGGLDNTAIGATATVGVVTNGTAIGFGANANANNKVRIGNASVTVIEGQVAYTFISDRNTKENFRDVDAEAALERLTEIPVTSWNYIGSDAKPLRHYGPMAQDFYAAFGNDGVGTFGSDISINSGDYLGILTLALQATAQRTADLKRENGRLQREIGAIGVALAFLAGTGLVFAVRRR